MYFRKFPKVSIDIKGDGNLVDMTDITRRAKFNDSTLLNYVNFDMYDVPDGSTPEQIAHDYYGDSNLHWVVLIANNIKDVYTDWPMSVDRFEKFVKSKYSNVDEIHHYEYSQESGDTSFVIELPNDSATTIPVGATAITNYEYEERILESKRRIRLIQPTYIGRIRSEFEAIIGR
jgi:hypothetical protein